MFPLSICIEFSLWVLYVAPHGKSWSFNVIIRLGGKYQAGTKHSSLFFQNVGDEEKDMKT
jgi:hypothetical protein